MNYGYMTMKEIGKLFGVTSHAIGRRLKELGLLDEDGRPSQMAFAGQLCEPRWTQDCQHYCWAWHGEKTVRLLEETGLTLAVHLGSER